MLFPSWPLMVAFLAASFVLAITPGPGVLYIVARSVAQGRRAGLASVAGVALGNLANAIGAAIGLAALFALSALAYSIVKYVGAAYLIYLGIRTLRTRPADLTVSPVAAKTLEAIFCDGFLVALFNPKTTIFFAAFLPQFMPSGTSSAAGSLALGALFVAIAAATDSLYALASSSIAPRVKQVGKWRNVGRFTSASVFIGLGLFTAFNDARSTK